jgi:hypothetical protein
MRTFGKFLLAFGMSAGLVLYGFSAAAKGKGKSAARGESAAPTASAGEVAKLRAVRLGDPKAGTFNWSSSPENVMAGVKEAIESKYQPRLEKAGQDPGKQQRVREERDREINTVKKSYTKFEGQKSGWDVSIIGPEFDQNTGEAVLVTKEENWTRYFFFFEGGLYKMYLAFNKDFLGGKSFQEFGKDMEAKYGRAKEVYRDEKMKGGVRHLLDHFEWNAGSDKLKLVDRSEFYGVYCLVLYDANTQARVIQRREVVNPAHDEKDALVEAVTAPDKNSRDGNDDIVDRITGKQVKKPGEEESHANIVVPSPSRSSSEGSSKSPASSPAKETENKKSKGGKKSDSALDGLEL